MTDWGSGGCGVVIQSIRVQKCGSVEVQREQGFNELVSTRLYAKSPETRKQAFGDPCQNVDETKK